MANNKESLLTTTDEIGGTLAVKDMGNADIELDDTSLPSLLVLREKL